MSKNMRVNLTLMLADNISFENIEDLIDNFDSHKVIYPENFDSQNISELDCLVYKRQGFSKTPDWAEKLYKATDIDISEKLSQTISQGASVLIPVTHNDKHYMFILNYSIGHFSVKKNAINKYFGIYIANKELVDGNAVIKRGKSRKISANPTNKDRMFGRPVDDDDFNIILDDNEVIREVTAYAIKDDSFYNSMVGSYTSLNITLNFDVRDEDESVSISKLKESLIKLIEIYDSVTAEDKKKLFKGLSPVEIDGEMRRIINKKLSSNLQDFFFFEPETDINLAQINKFKIGEVEYDEFSLSKYAISQQVTYENLADSNVYIYDENGNELKRWKLLDCLYGEFEANETVYFISQGDLFDINRDKYEDVKERVKRIEDASFSLSQTKIDEVNADIQVQIDRGDKKIRREFIYNKKLSEELAAELFDEQDKHIIIYDTQIEVCDVFIPQTKEFIHSKIRRGPESLSHLFTQGLVSADSYSKSTDRFITEVNKRLSDPAKHIDKKFNGSTVRYIILTTNNVENKLPFFAQMHLNNVVGELESKGFQVLLSWEKRVNI